MTGLAARYWREIAAVLLIKAVALYAIHESFFDRPVARSERIRHLQTSVYGVEPAGDNKQETSGND